MALLLGCYERTDEGGLFCPLTGQRLRALRAGADEFQFEYQDGEVSLPVAASYHPPGPKAGPRSVLLDWTQPGHEDVRARYGLWRRLTWFLLDALLVWSYERHDDEGGVSIKGGWLNGSWSDEVHCSSGLITSGRHRDSLLEEIAPFAPFPLDDAAPRWRFERGLDGARECRIATLDDELADLAVPIGQQLAEVPRFVSSDGAILFFHKVRPHVGPDYAPWMDYGLSLPDFAFYFTGMHASLLARPIRIDRQARPNQASVLEAGSGPYPGGIAPPRPRLHPQLREQLYFAMLEVKRLCFEEVERDRPVMADVEFGQEMPFGQDLWYISEPPMSVGLPFCQIDFRLPLRARASAPPPPRPWPAVLALAGAVLGRGR